MNLTPEQAQFLLLAIDTAYDTAAVEEIFAGDFDDEVMEDALDQLRKHSRQETT